MSVEEILIAEYGKDKVSIEKAKNLLGYNPKFSIEDGIKEAVSWYYKNLK